MLTSEQLLKSFDNYVDAVGESFAAVRTAIEAGHFAGAAQLMTAVSTEQARMSIRMQSAMTKLAESR